MVEKGYTGQQSLTSQADSWAVLTPHNSVDFDFIPKAIHVSSASGGSFVAVGEDDVAVPFYAAAGAILPIRPKRINTTGLTGGMTFVGLK
jgi:hypothetical protein